VAKLEHHLLARAIVIGTEHDTERRQRVARRADAVLSEPAVWVHVCAQIGAIGLSEQVLCGAYIYKDSATYGWWDDRAV
jgi:hypothetical protein